MYLPVYILEYEFKWLYPTVFQDMKKQQKVRKFVCPLNYGTTNIIECFGCILKTKCIFCKCEGQT